jgi:hypothetical protein
MKESMKHIVFDDCASKLKVFILFHDISWLYFLIFLVIHPARKQRKQIIGGRQQKIGMAVLGCEHQDSRFFNTPNRRMWLCQSSWNPQNPMASLVSYSLPMLRIKCPIQSLPFPLSSRQPRRFSKCHDGTKRSADSCGDVLASGGTDGSGSSLDFSQVGSLSEILGEPT